MSQPEENFTWMPFYRELARKLFDFRADRTPLVRLIYENPQIAPANLKRPRLWFGRTGNGSTIHSRR